MEYWFMFLIVAVASYLIGLMIGKGTPPKDVSGFIIVDKYDPDGPYMFLELGEDVEELCERQTAMLGIIVRDPSQD